MIHKANEGKGEIMEENQMHQAEDAKVEDVKAEDIEVEDLEVENTASEQNEETSTEAQQEVNDQENKNQDSDTKAAEYLDKWQRLMAEFDNYRKRSEKEKSDSYDYAVSNTVAEILPVIDNFERALKIESTDKKLYSGVEMIYKQMINVLENLNVKAIEAVGNVFDPNLHNAIMHIDDESLGENIVAEEVQKGYLYKEKVIRHSLVKVAN